MLDAFEPGFCESTRLASVGTLLITRCSAAMNATTRRVTPLEKSSVTRQPAASPR
jgi:hypothetical protein